MDGKKKTNASAHCVWIVAYANLNTTDFLKLVSSLAFFFLFSDTILHENADCEML